MKKLLLSVALFLALGATTWAQAPKQFNYQGIARSASGTPMASTTIGLRVTILEGSASGTVDYQETRTTMTNSFGLYNVAIGGSGATVTAGAANLGAVNWASGDKFISVEIDPLGAANYSPAGNAQLLSVPFALYAAGAPSSGVTSVTSGAGLTPGTITSTGTISMPSIGTPGTKGSSVRIPVITTDPQGRVTSLSDSAIGVGGGTVTAVTAGTGLAGGTITTTGTLSLGTAGTASTYGSGTQVPVFTTDAYGRVISVVNTPITVAGSGTVTSVTAGAGLSGGTFTTSGTVSMPAVGTPGTYGTATGIPRFTTDAYGRVTAVTVNPVAPSITSTGTANYITKFTAPLAIANSGMYNTTTNQVGLGTITPIATFDAESTSDTMAGFFASSTGSPSVNVGVLTSYLSSTVDQGIAFQANANNNLFGNNTLGVQGIGTAIGVQAFGASQQTSFIPAAGVKGVEGNGMGDDLFALGVAGYGTPDAVGGSPVTAYGVVGNASGGGTNYSGYFVGDVHIGGAMTALTKAFKIDHPLDPANKYLYHSCVESNEMMDIYNGNITTDASGTATVSLPSYFEALNKDFRYQLTVIGSFAQAMVSKEVLGNKFEIKTNQPNTKVSWQITGVRHDVGANAHPIIAEVDKEPTNKGKYLTPQLYGKPESDMIGFEVAHSSKKAAQVVKKTTVPEKSQK